MTMFFFCNRLKTLKKEINVAEEKASERKRKKEETKIASATKPKRLSRQKYPLQRGVTCISRLGLDKQ